MIRKPDLVGWATIIKIQVEFGMEPNIGTWANGIKR